MMPTGDGVAVRAEQVSRHDQMGSARIPALDGATLEVRAREFLLELARYRSRTMSMVFPSFPLFPRVPLEENIELALRLAEVEPGERGRRVREALDRAPGKAAESSPKRAFRRGAAARRLGTNAGAPACSSSGGRANRRT
jgi:predicted ABC-type transport system involved in lysophospholipase L1 biosynthesis ATPase subunit